MGVDMPAKAQLVQFHRCLSAPTKCDPWHGMRYAPSRYPQFITNGEPRASGSSIPGSLRAEYGGSAYEGTMGRCDDRLQYTVKRRRLETPKEHGLYLERTTFRSKAEKEHT